MTFPKRFIRIVSVHKQFRYLSGIFHQVSKHLLDQVDAINRSCPYGADEDFLTVPFWDSVSDLWVSFQRPRRINGYSLKTALIYEHPALCLGSCHNGMIILRTPQCRNGIERHASLLLRECARPLKIRNQHYKMTQMMVVFVLGVILNCYKVVFVLGVI